MLKIKKTGLALGGGAVLGAAHIGVLRALKELEVKVDVVTGTSIGAFVAALYAFGKELEEIEAIASSLKWVDITGVSLSRYALLSNKKLGELIIEQIGERNIEDAPIPLAMVATDITNGERVVLDKGPVAEAVMASTCIPGVFIPVERDGIMLVDGGIVENVPVETARSLGADFVIGVDLNAKHNYEKPQNILDVLMNSFHFLMQQSDKPHSQLADVLIKPDLADFNRSNMKQVDELMQKGYDDSRAMIAELKEELEVPWLQQALQRLKII